MLQFNLKTQLHSGLARTGELVLARGSVQTPTFMPVGTVGAVKTLLPDELRALGAEMILGNTYHLYLRPGHKQLEQFGGLAEWNRWQGPILTDSGGFQVFSLGNRQLVASNATLTDPAEPTKKANYDADEVNAGLVKITEEGIRFTSHLDGSQHFFSPENVIDIQLAIGSDIMMMLDECTEYPATYERAKSSMERTHRYAKRGSGYFQALKATNPALEAHNLFGIAQGSTFADLRQASVEFMSSLPLDGIAVGGVSVGEGKTHMYQVMEWTGPLLPPKLPHYLMGIGEPADIIRAVAHGFDMFDCVLPTRLGRYGVAWQALRDTSGLITDYHKIDLRAAQFKSSLAVIDPHCHCPACIGGYSVSYLNHLLKEREVVGIRLVSLHNIATLLTLMKEIRTSIDNQSFNQVFAAFLT